MRKQLGVIVELQEAGGVALLIGLPEATFLAVSASAARIASSFSRRPFENECLPYRLNLEISVSQYWYPCYRPVVQRRTRRKW